MPGSRPVPPQLLLRARATVNDEQLVLVSSVNGWKAAAGPIVENHLYNGEVYDSRLQLIDRDGNDLSSPKCAGSVVWEQVCEMSTIPPTAALVPQNMPPIRKLRRLPALSVTPSISGAYILDFGQNTAGIVRTRIPVGLAAGSNVSIFFAEALTTHRIPQNQDCPCSDRTSALRWHEISTLRLVKSSQAMSGSQRSRSTDFGTLKCMDCLVHLK